MVVSPFLDRQHGTEICIIEQIERLAKQAGWEIHLYSQRAEDIRGMEPVAESNGQKEGVILWHKVNECPGPHLLKYLWWFVANRWQRQCDRVAAKVNPDLIYSPGINCLDADVIVVHIVFHEFYRRVKNELGLAQTALRNLPRVIHRRLYYKFIMALERKVYCDPGVHLIAVSHSLAKHLESHFGRTDVTVIPNAVDTERFSEAVRLDRRAASRDSLHFGEDEFVVLLIGNDWKNKGLETLVRACALLLNLPLRVLVVGSDDPALFRPVIRELQMEDRVRIELPTRDVMRFYAAADLYAGPSLEDSFGLPILEAMACGLPVIASMHAGSSEMIEDGKTGILVRDPTDHVKLSQFIQMVYSDKPLARAMGEAASRSTRANFNWEQNAAMTRDVMDETLSRRK